MMRDISGLMKPTFFINTIRLPNEVKYLGLMLYKGLIWKKQLDEVTNRAYQIFWSCIDIFGGLGD
jgi:hypothetical protein